MSESGPMPTDLEAEIRASRGRVLGEAVWRRLCLAGGLDPKDPDQAEPRAAIVAAVQAASSVLDEAGFDGLENWLEMEAKWGHEGV